MQLTATERIRLLIHIVRELRVSHGITVDILKVADRPIRHKIRPKSRLRFLEEIYDIREAEERLLSKQTGNVFGKVIVIFEANFFPTDKRTFKQISYPDAFDKVKRASRASAPTRCTDINQNSTQFMGAFVSDWAYPPDLNASLTSFTYYSTSQHAHQGENCQDHRQSLSHSGQPAIPFQAKSSQWEPSLLETSSFMASTDYTSQFPYWYEGANALTQGEQYKIAHHVSASGPPVYTMAGISQLTQSNGIYQS